MHLMEHCDMSAGISSAVMNNLKTVGFNYGISSQNLVRVIMREKTGIKNYSYFIFSNI
jgi:hypothetical protein